MTIKFNSYLKYFFEKCSKVALIGFAFFAFGVFLQIFNIGYQHKKLDLLKVELTRVKSERSPLANKNNSTDTNLGLRLLNKNELPYFIESIDFLAKKNNIFYESVDYNFLDLPVAQLQSYEVTMPVSGTYLDIIKLIDQVTHLKEGIILKNVEFSRDNNQVNDIDCLLQFTVYLQEN